MAIFDVRETREMIDEIHFADKSVVGYRAYRVEQDGDNTMFIADGCACVTLESVEHTRNLIKALEEAIKLGWVK